MRLDERTVLVVGGSSGIGLACAVQAAARGAQVVVAARDAERLASAVATIGPAARTVPVDVTDHDSVGALLDGIGVLDHVVVTAGDAVAAPLSSVDLDLQRRIMELRFWGAWHVCRGAAPLLPADGSITLCSGAGVARPRPGRPVAVAAGGAVQALVRALALELAPIRVNAVAPGPTRTPLLERFYGGTVPDGTGEPDDIADAVLFLMTNGFVTGTVLPVDGGFTLA